MKRSWFLLTLGWSFVLSFGAWRWYIKYHPIVPYTPHYETIYVTNYIDVVRAQPKIDPWQPNLFYAATNNLSYISNVIYATPFVVTNLYLTNIFLGNLVYSTNYVH